MINMLIDDPYNIKLFKYIEPPIINDWVILVLRTNPVNEIWTLIPNTDFKSVAEQIYDEFNLNETKATKNELEKLLQEELSDAPFIVCPISLVTTGLTRYHIQISSKFYDSADPDGAILVLYSNEETNRFYIYEAKKLNIDTHKKELRSRFLLKDLEITNFIEEFNKMVD